MNTAHLQKHFDRSDTEMFASFFEFLRLTFGEDTRRMQRYYRDIGKINRALAAAHAEAILTASDGMTRIENGAIFERDPYAVRDEKVARLYLEAALRRVAIEYTFLEEAVIDGDTFGEEWTLSQADNRSKLHKAIEEARYHNIDVQPYLDAYPWGGLYV